MFTQHATTGQPGRQGKGEHALATTMVTGGEGVRLHVVETGNPEGRPIVFIHGVSQCWLTWDQQLRSDLADDYRLVAFDLRGHGLSDKPIDGYSGAEPWADDLNAVIQSLGLVNPVLCGWSYGPLVILDYLRQYGEERVGGIQFIGGISKLGSDEAMSVLSPQFLSIFPGLLATDAAESARSLESLLRMCFTSEPSPEELYQMLGYNLSVPPYVRQALFARSFDNDDLLRRLRIPVLLTHGADDAVVSPTVVDQHRATMPHAQVHLMANAAHGPFRGDDAPAFNQRLREFCESL